MPNKYYKNAMDKWREKAKARPDYKIKRSAHRKLEHGIKRGEVQKSNCIRCGKSEGVVAHHEDYSKPLEVMWLCRFHHRERHKEIANAGENHEQR